MPTCKGQVVPLFFFFFFFTLLGLQSGGVLAASLRVYREPQEIVSLSARQAGAGYDHFVDDAAGFEDRASWQREPTEFHQYGGDHSQALDEMCCAM